MKVCTREHRQCTAPAACAAPRQATPIERHNDQRQRDKEFMRVMNEIVAGNGILTDDKFYRVL